MKHFDPDSFASDTAILAREIISDATLTLRGKLLAAEQWERAADMIKQSIAATIADSPMALIAAHADDALIPPLPDGLAAWLRGLSDRN